MPNTTFAEWLLRLFTDEKRAASIVGDLAEESGDKGRAWFWQSYASVLASFVWRPFAAFVFATAVAWYGGSFYPGMGFYYPLNVYARHGLAEAWLLAVVMAGASSAFIFLFSAIRFGLNDRMTRLALGFAVLGSVSGWFFFVSYMPAVATVAVAILCGYALMSQVGRRSIAAIVALWVAFCLIQRAGYWVFIEVHRNVLDRWQYVPAYSVWFYFCYISGLALCAALCAYAHRRFVAGGELARLT
jgi:hypothetical protein